MLTRTIAIALQYKRMMALLGAVLCLLGLLWHDRTKREQAAQKTLHDAEKYRNEPANLASPKKAFERYQAP